MCPCLRTDVRVGHPQLLMLRSGETPGFTPNLDIYYLLGDEKKLQCLIHSSANVESFSYDSRFGSLFFGFSDLFCVHSEQIFIWNTLVLLIVNILKYFHSS